MVKARVYVTYKPSVFDPQGDAIKGAIHQIGYTEVEDVRMGKCFDLTIEPQNRPVEEILESICDRLLANVNMETYRYEILEEK